MIYMMEKWWAVRDLNPGPKDYEHKEQFLYCVIS
jgi:hypothetical protein